MLNYQMMLAWRSIKKTPWLCTIVVLALGLGVALAMVSYAGHHAIIQEDLRQKDDRLFMVQADSWHTKEAFRGPINEMPGAFSYRDVTAFLRAKPAPRQTILTNWGGTIALTDSSRVKPKMIFSMIATHDYFAMFDRPFLFGGPWDDLADTTSQNRVVISEVLNNYLFNGKNSVGEQLMFEGKPYQIVGVIQRQPNRKNFSENMHWGRQYPGDAYFPLGIVQTLELTPWQTPQCPEDKRDYGTGFKAWLSNSCVWLNYWVEFDKPSQKLEFEGYLTRYIQEQKQQGFYPRPLKFSVLNLSESLINFRQNQNMFSVTSVFGLGILFVCIVNSVALLLAKFMRHAQECGVRRAMGASRMNIFIQHLVESGLLGIFGGFVGLLFTYIGLQLLKLNFSFNPPNPIESEPFAAILTLDLHVLSATLLLSVIASFAAGLYPAWKICRTPSALYLKQQ